MGYNSLYRPYNPIASAVDTAASMQEIFNGVEDRKRRQDELDFQHTITLREQNRADVQDARAAESHALDLKSKTQAYDESTEQIRKRKENEKLYGLLAKAHTGADFSPEDEAALRLLGLNPSLSNSPDILDKQANHLQNVEAQLPELYPYLVDPSKRTVVTDAQFPNFFQSFNIAYGPSINKGTDANGDTGAFKYVNTIASDNNNNLSLGVLVKPKNGDPYTSAITAGRGGHPDEPVVQIPAQGAGIKVRLDAKQAALAKSIYARLAANGDKEGLARAEAIANDESMQQAFKKTAAQLMEYEKQGLSLTESQKKQLFLVNVPSTVSLTHKEKLAYADVFDDEKRYIAIGKNGLWDKEKRQVVAAPEPEVKYQKTESGRSDVVLKVDPSGQKRPEVVWTGVPKPFTPHAPKEPKPFDRSAEEGKFNVKNVAPRLREIATGNFFTTKGAMLYSQAITPEQKMNVFATPGALTEEGQKKLKDVSSFAERGRAKIVGEDMTADQALKALWEEDHRQTPAPSASKETLDLFHGGEARKASAAAPKAAPAAKAAPKATPAKATAGSSYAEKLKKRIGQ